MTAYPRHVERWHFLPPPLLIIAFIIIVFMGNIIAQNIASSTPEKVFTKYIGFQRSRNYRKAYYTCFSSAYRKRMDLSAFEKLQNDNSATLGFALNKEVLHTQVLRDRKGRTIYIMMALGFYPTGVATENYFFVKELKGWRIDGFEISSPLLDRAERERMKDFIKQLPQEVRESYRRMLEAQGRSVE